MNRVACSALVALCAALFAQALAAQAYPSRPIRLVVAQSAGGNADFVARSFGSRLGERFKQQVVIDNRPGGAGVIGTEIVARAAPDGHTLLLAPTALGVNPSLYARLPYDTLRDFACISHLARAVTVVVVNAQSPVKTIADLVSLAKSRPGKLHYGSSGVAAATHLAGEIFKSMTGVDIVHVPYKGAPPAIVDLMSGQVDMMFASPPSVMPHVRAGRLRAIATSGPKRAAYLPDLPTVAESGVPGYEATIWQVILAPAKTPAPVLDRLNRELAGIGQQQELRDRLAVDGSETVAGTQAECRAHVAAEIARYAKVVKAIGLKAE